MNTNVKPDLHISGSGVCDGGQYNLVRISGTARVEGALLADSIEVSGTAQMREVTASRLRVSGTAQLSGALQAARIDVNGSLTVQGQTRARAMQVSGACYILGDAQSDTVNVSGVLDIKGGLTADSVTASALRCQGDATCKSATLSGGKIHGVLRADSVELTLNESLYADKILCKTLVMQPARLLGILQNKSLECDEIQGERLQLNRAAVRLVRGDAVTVGRGCKIDRVEYKTSLHIDPDAIVQESVRL